MTNLVFLNNNAIIKAENNNLKWAVSNDAFELWYVLHFQNCNIVITESGLYSPTAVGTRPFPLTYYKTYPKAAAVFLIKGVINSFSAIVIFSFHLPTLT